MDAKKIDKLAHRVGANYEPARRRRRAARRLARTASPEAVAALAREIAESVRYHPGRPPWVIAGDEDVTAIAHRTFAELTDQAAIDAVCGVWADTRNLWLGALVQGCGWVAAQPPGLRVLTALYTERLDALVSGGPDLVRALVAAADAEPPPLRGRALAALGDLDREDAREVVSELAVEGGSEAALEAALAGGFVPADPARRAALLFLAGEFDAYAELDFDGALLRSVHVMAPGHLRARLARRARESGRVEWLRAVADVGRPGRLGELTDGEWEAAIATLTAAGRWEELWRLALQGPPVWSVRMLRELGRQRWLPTDEAERAGHADLIALAETCPDDAPLGSVFDHGDHLDGPAFAQHGPPDGFAMSADGSLIAQAGGSGSLSGTHGVVTLWHLPSGERAGRVTGLTEPIRCLAITPDGSRLIIGSGYDMGGTLELRRLPSGTPVGAPERMTYPVTSVAVTPDGKLFATASEKSPSISLRHSPSGASVGRVEIDSAGTTSGVESLAVTPDGALLASGHGDGAVRLWRLPSGGSAKTLKGRRGDGVMGLAVSPDGSLLAAATYFEGIRLWRLRRLPHEIPAGRLASPAGATCLAITPDGSTLLAGGGAYDNETRLWRLPSGAEAGTLGPQSKGVRGIVVTRDGGLLATADSAGVRLWRSPLVALCRTPVDRVDLADVERVRQTDGEQPAVRAWLDLIAALVRWRHRHDIEVGDAAQAAGRTDIELDRGVSACARRRSASWPTRSTDTASRCAANAARPGGWPRTAPRARRGC